MAGDEFDLSRRVALVTGGSRGIGRAVALALARHGAAVAIASRKIEGCEAVAEAIRAAGGQASAHACHVGEPAAIARTLAEIDARYGRVDILVNNAATNPSFGPALEMDLAAWQKTVDVNIRGYFVTAVEAARRMRRQGKGSIVNVASVSAFRPMENQVCYSLTKAAIVNMTQGLAREWAPYGIRVNALAPGIVETKFAATMHQDPKMRAMLERLVPLGRIAQPEEMAGAVVYLASDAASYTTGSCLMADGGYVA